MALKETSPSSSSSNMEQSSATAGGSSSSRSIPKVETNVLKLLEANPTADGRGVKIAIMDTGCDLEAAGLQTTSDDGKPKYLDFLDCTGDGDIVMNAKYTTIPKDNNRTILGLSGKDLVLGNCSWAEKVDEVRLGGVRLYELLPRSVVRRLQRERKAAFAHSQRQLIAQTQQQLSDLQRQIDNCKKDDNDKDDDNKKEDPKTALIKKRKDAQVLLEQYQNMLSNDDFYKDAGPYMDVLLYHDKDDETYKVVIDLEATGDLTKATPMAPFAKARQTGTLQFGSAVTFCVQVYDNGSTVSIVTDAGSHGTHVAGIAAANFGNDDNAANNKHNKNGVAPGAQILACKIGDGRLGSAETGTGLIRALIAAKQYGCDLINLSYGEPSWQPDSGRVAQVFSDAVRKWGMTVFTSAGNDGPALSSLGSPGTLSDCITVGAYVSTDMMIDQYSTLPPPSEDEEDSATLEDACYYFSSRGPTPDGALPDICAPGGAIAPIPRHSLQGKAQYHGTSMSSPNACGVAACVLSALKQQGIESVNPAELRRGLLTSALPITIADTFAQGTGLISATDSVDYITQHHGKSGQNLTFDVTIPSKNNARGIYIRDAPQLNGPLTFTVNVIPHFSHANVRTLEEMNELLSLELDLKLVPSEPWVTCPERMSLLSAQERNGQNFAIRLSTKDLPPGVHFATVDAVDSADPARGSLFQVPITVIVPHKPTNHEKEEEPISLLENGMDMSMVYKLTPGAPNRRFLDVPTMAEWATIKIKSLNPNPSESSPKRLMMHAVPFVRGDLPNTEIQLKRLVAVTEGVEKEFHLKVKGGSTLELCLQLLWLSNSAPTSVITTVEFHSLNTRSPTLVSSQPVMISPAREFARLGASAPLRTENLKPKASLDTVQRTLRPSNYDIVNGSPDRDIMPPSDAELRANPGVDGTEIYNMFLKYDFEITSDDAVKVVPRVASLFNQLYDSPLDSQIWELRDSNSQLLGSGSSMHDESPISLTKGNYTVTFHTRHPNRQVLEQVKDLPFQLLMSTKDALDCKVYSEIDKASTPTITGDGRKEVGAVVLRTGSFLDLYVARPTAELPSWAAPGDVLVGKVVLDQARADVTTMALAYPVPPKSKVKKLNENKLPDIKEDEKTLDEIIFDSKVTYLSKLRSKKDSADEYKNLSETLLQENSTSISLLTELLSYAKEAKQFEQEERAKELEKVYNLLLVSNGGPVDESALAQYFGVAAPDEDELKEDPEATKLKKKMDEQKKLLQMTLLALCDSIATLVASEASSSDESSSAWNENFGKYVHELKKWASGSDAFSDQKDKLTYTLTCARHVRLCKGENGNAISTLMDAMKKLSSTESYKGLNEELLTIYRSLGDDTQHIIHYMENDMKKRFPPKASSS